MARFPLVSFLLLFFFVLAVITAEKNTKAKVRDNSKVSSVKTEKSAVRGGQAGNRKRKTKKVDKKSRRQFMRQRENKNRRRKNQLKGSKREPNEQGKSKPKRKIKRKNNAKKRQKKNKKFTRQSCSSNEVNLTCMKNAMEGMLFEKNQITNYLKQAKRLTNHGSISTNKVGKKDNFDASRKHLLWALGGNLSDPKCGPNTTAEKTA